MANEKETERNQDNITLKKLKYIIILCSVACIICSCGGAHRFKRFGTDCFDGLQAERG